MELGANRILETAVYKTLHAQGFSRSSSQASFVLTDLLNRYLHLLSSTCAKYAQHAGRRGITPRDAFSALDELGVSMDELHEYGTSEGAELGRYAVYSGRRVEDLHEFKAYLGHGLGHDRDDAIPLVYAPLPVDTDEDEDEESIEGPEDAEVNGTGLEVGMNGMDLDSICNDERKFERPHLRPPTPPLPLSPISNPSSPARKRQRTSSWQPPEHVPDFLPPFPSDTTVRAPSPRTPPLQPPIAKAENITVPIPQPQTLNSSSGSDYLTPIPYSQSSLSTTPEWHLPSPIPPPPLLQTRTSRLPTPQTQPSLIGAYHHILTHPPSSNSSSITPARHKVAMALLSQTQVSPRWEPPDTLYSSIGPCAPRITSIGPSFPVPIATASSAFSEGKLGREEDREKDRKSNMPSAPPRSITSTERLTSLVSQQPSRIPELARLVLPGPVYKRATRLNHPPVLQRGTQKLTYGSGVNAPWNSNAPPTAAIPTAVKGKDALPNGKETVVIPKILPDARMYATWDYEQKHYNEPLAPNRRGRIGSIQGPSGMPLSLVKSESRAG